MADAMDRVRSGLLKHIAANPSPNSFEDTREVITEIQVGQKVLNTMTALGRPVEERHRLTLPLRKGRIPSPPRSMQQRFIDDVLTGKIDSLRAFCQTLGWSDLVTSMRDMTPLHRSAVESLELQQMQQWRSFLALEPLLIDEPDLSKVVREVGDFIMSAAHGAIDDRQMPGRWTSGGAWSPAI